MYRCIDFFLFYFFVYRPNNRLLANRVLRVRKLVQYIAEKLEVKDDSCLELLCGETVLTPTMTLAAIKQHILKTSGDIPLSYRLKEEVTTKKTAVQSRKK